MTDLSDYQHPKNTNGLDETRGSSTAAQHRAIRHLAAALPDDIAKLYALAVGGRMEELDKLSEWKAGLLIEGLQSGDPASVAVSFPMAGTVRGLLESSGHNPIAPHTTDPAQQ
jgi:hypothetical protein